MLPDLAAAIRNNDLFLLYQPQVTADGRNLVAAEALVRWRDPERGIVPPDQFVQLAERNGLIDQLGSWVLEHACREAASWTGVTVAVNVSPLQFRRPDFVAFVTHTVREAGLDFRRLEIEITESAYFDDPDRAEEALRELRALGIRIALDDFGTGYSSLSYMRRLPLDKIKIDKSFITEIGHVDGAAIVQAVVALARALGLKVTAEGVETVEQQRFLRACGCHFLQGYLFSKPVPAIDLVNIAEDLKKAL
ncbi:MAG: EAL domain-containing protein [Beijerinckiaceae bacterium]|jgi:diguanylate cyclase|nr:EAL domain-containing protein [Beijerinckiaceae bacterium]MDO9440149.1 EAL domain-containing protein [Beijerinckiaceae bacterium]